MPSVSSPAKVSRIRGFGADLTSSGDRYADALAAALRWAGSSRRPAGARLRSSETILGQGTVGLELQEQAPDLDTVLVAVGGGGLIAGVAAWYAGRTRVVGVEPEAAPTLTSARGAGGPVDAPAGGIAADSLAPRRVGELVFPIVAKYARRPCWSRTTRSPSAGDALARPAARGRARRRDSLGRHHLRRLCAGPRRAGRRGPQRRQHRRSQLRRDVLTAMDRARGGWSAPRQHAGAAAARATLWNYSKSVALESF